jgi:hypothetical protein
MHISYNLPYLSSIRKEHKPYNPGRPLSAHALIMPSVKNKTEITLREHLQAIQSDGGKARWAGMTARRAERGSAKGSASALG